jgi:hypothetical protein
VPRDVGLDGRPLDAGLSYPFQECGTDAGLDEVGLAQGGSTQGLDEGGLAQGGSSSWDEGREEQSREADGSNRRCTLGMSCSRRVQRHCRAGGGRTSVGLEDGGATHGRLA